MQKRFVKRDGVVVDIFRGKIVTVDDVCFVLNIDGIDISRKEVEDIMIGRPLPLPSSNFTIKGGRIFGCLSGVGKIDEDLKSSFLDHSLILGEDVVPLSKHQSEFIKTILLF